MSKDDSTVFPRFGRTTIGSRAERYLICRRIMRGSAGLLVILVPFLFGACTSTKAKQPNVPTGPAFNYAAVTTTLKRGVSSPAEVKEAMGEPQGAGEFLFPTDTKPRPIWFYEKVKFDVSGQKLDFQQDVLLIIFKDGRFDGFLWFSDAHKNW
jgi:hypothetical protein